MRITVGHTPDADDAFMFYGMFTGGVASPDFEVSHVIEDIERLNQKAKGADLDVTAVSVHACAHIPGYTVLRTGGSFGIGYGPVVVSRDGMDPGELCKKKIAIPGTMTSAFLLLQLMIGKFEYVAMDFDRVPQAVADGTADAGLVIHETQIAYEHEGLKKVADVGQWWDRTTGGLPVPLGINVMKSSHGDDTISKFDRYLRDSIQYGLDNFDDAVGYAMKYGRGRPRDLIARFVKMYVNDITRDMGESGEESIRRLFEMAGEKKLVPDFELRIAPVI